MSAPKPAHEERRLETLRRLQLLDTPPDQAFDDLTRLASHVCQMPIALISLVDDERQWFKSAIGLEVTETPRDVAFCAHAILTPDTPMQVPDALLDERFAGNPLVVGDPHVRAYASVPLIWAGTAAIGTLCVIDRVPRRLTADQVEAIQCLGRQVVSQIALREAARRLSNDLAANRQMAAVLDRTPDFVAFLDREGTPTYLNRAARDMCAIPPDVDAATLSLAEVVGSPDAAGELRASMAEAVSEGAQWSESTMIARTGRRTPVSRLLVAEPAPGGGAEFYAVLARDMSERIRDEASIRASEKHLRRVVESLQEALFETDSAGNWTYLNPAWLEVTGFAVTDSVGRSITDLVDSEDQETLRRRFMPLLNREKESARFEIRCRTQYRGVRWFEIQTRATEDGEGRLVGTIGTLRDITEQHELSDALMKASQDALAASRLKSEFVANMSHEVRTPINGVIGLTTLLLDSSLTDEQRDLADGIKSSAEALLTIVNDVLDLSKVEAGKLSIEPVSFELRKTLQQALEPVSVKAQKKGLTLALSFDDALPPAIISDPMRIRQILINLADNAIKFTHQGRVEVKLRAETSGDKARVRFEVVDGGIGIPADKLDAIFDKFTQADTSTTRKYGGTGLGLAICRQLVDLMGGQIGVISEVGRGTTFWFELPLVEAVRSKPAAASVGAMAAALRRFTVLVAEDNTINQKVARRFLERLGCAVEVVENGEDAVARVRERPYDAVFMDCQMPKMDGYEATRAIRQLAEHADLPIIAMTAHAMQGDREKCLQAGMSDYVSKPLQPDALAGALARIAPSGASHEENAA